MSLRVRWSGQRQASGRVRRHFVAALMLVALGGALAGGCSDDGTSVDPLPPPPPLPDTPDKCLDTFKTAYTGMDYEAYQEVLHPNFRFLFKPEDAVGLPDDVLIRDEELAIASNMFSGLPLPQPDGPPVPGITLITIFVLNRKEAWAPVEASAPNFYEPEDAEHGRHASLQATFEVEMRIERDVGGPLQVAGDTVFFVAARDSLVGGVLRPYYQLRGQRDLTRSTGGKLRPAEDTSWGSVKNMYGSWN